MQAVVCVSEPTRKARPYIHRILSSMTLIVALKTADHKIVIGSDGLTYTADEATNSNNAYPTNKLYHVKNTNWTLAFAGSGAVNAFYKQLEAEVELGRRPPFDSHLEIGGPVYLNALTAIASEAKRAAPERKMPETTVLLAGFDIHKAPYMLMTVVPLGGYFVASEGGTVLGAQDSTALWLLNTVACCCTTLDAVKKLVIFTIWEMSKRDMRIGRLEAEYPITLCLMEPDKPNNYETIDRTAVDRWLKDWQENLQNCFMRLIDSQA